MNTLKTIFSFFLFFSFLISCNNSKPVKEEESKATSADNSIEKFKGTWQGMTYGSSPYDPMFTFTIQDEGKWTDISFGREKAIESNYQYSEEDSTLSLYSAKGSKLHTFKLEPATKDQKEKLVEQLPQKETYRALVCYRYHEK